MPELPYSQRSGCPVLSAVRNIARSKRLQAMRNIATSGRQVLLPVWQDGQLTVGVVKITRQELTVAESRQRGPTSKLSLWK